MIYETTISKNYVSDWGVKEGIREIIQNSLDAGDKGYKSSIAYSRKDRKLVVKNRGATLPKESLLLGTTTKAGDNSQRGQYGEGFKVGSLALVRAGKDVQIRFGRQKWKCDIRPSEHFGTEVLAFEMNKRLEEVDDLAFTVGNITPEEWKDMEKMFLHIYSQDPKMFLQTPDGRVLLDKNLKGRIYSGGIYVNTKADLEYGYDFNVDVLRLNRDRNMIDSFEVTWATSKMWALLSANKKGKLFDAHSMLKKGSPDVEYISQFSDYTVTGNIVDKFIKENSDKAYPVTSDEEATRVRSLGYSPVYSSSSYAGTLRKKLGTIDDLERTVTSEYSLFQNLTPIDDANIQWVFEVMHKVDDKFKFNLVIAVFAVGTSRSKMDKLDIIVNSNLLKKKYDLLHEVVLHYSNQSKKEATQVWKELYRNTVEGVRS